jgi:DNA-binding LytR/AlgR family response regulator
MKTVEENLSGTDFIRIHKSYIVSLDKIERIEKNTIHLQGEVIPIGRFYKRAFDEILKLHQL